MIPSRQLKTLKPGTSASSGFTVGASVLAGPIGNERQIREATLIFVIDQALDGRAGSDGDGNALAKVESVPFQAFRNDVRIGHGALFYELTDGLSSQSTI